MPTDTPNRVAAIDCGTNSIRLLVSDVVGENKIDIVREMRIVRLGQDVDKTGHLADEAIARTLTATREFATLIRTLGADRVRFCATSAARDADNAEEFSDAIEGIIGVRPVVLSGEEEAKASFLGAAGDLPVARTLVVDIGGGSTELIVGTGDHVEWSVSLNIGSVRMTERYLSSDPPTVAEASDCMAYVDTVLDKVIGDIAPIDLFVGVAGTITTVAAHTLAIPSYDSDAIHHAELKLGDVSNACISLARMTVADRRALPFMHPGRADVIGGGALILDRLIERLPLHTATLLVSEHDILDGIAWSLAV
ncbi:MAG: Ppx/GppA family phosphatase [Kineosporiaceae bacterium]|nr:Ppx/GppA family phosphatase [Aeromicrobium sp.]